ncbi:MAG: nucleotidyltransferase domain-containing protein, partial [Gemmataceae bacterium]
PGEDVELHHGQEISCSEDAASATLVSRRGCSHARYPSFCASNGEQFQPDKIILFGSYAYGTPHADSDVDILVVMPARNQIDQAVRIDCAIAPPLSSRSHRPYSEEHEAASGRRRLFPAGDHVKGENPL